MTKPDSTLIAVVMDRSFSMNSIKAETISGFNAFLEEQKKLPGECVMYYTHFNDNYDIVHAYVPIAQFQPLNEYTYSPAGNTALLDAIGSTIIKIGSDLSSRPEEERPSTVVFVIQTDGEENASRVYDLEKVQNLIAEHRDVWKWNFLFLGASEASIKQGARIGVAQASTLQYSGQNSRMAFAAAGSNVSYARTTGSIREFTEEERKDSA